MPKVFKTNEDSPDQVEVVGVGVAGSYGRGGIPVERAAEICSELQDSGSSPLSGKALTEASEAFAEARGLEIVDVKPKDMDGLAQEWGVAPEPIPAGQAAEEEHERIFGGGDEDEVAEESETDKTAESGQKTEA